jgi:16S rRNA (guanine527-N7)-methyltransferase
MNEQQFIEALRVQGIDLNDQQIAQFRKYYDMLVEWNQKVNLTAVTDKEEVYLKHFYDSLTPLFYVDIKDSASLCDVGAGAGFPSIPMKIVRPDLKITIVDSLNKRINFLNELSAELGLDKMHLVHDRAENFGQYTARHMFDVVTARAVANLNVLLELCLPLVRTGGHFLVLKGKKGLEELENSTFVMDLLGGSLIDTFSFELPEEDSERHILNINKIRKTPAKYPRKPGTPNKSPLK